MQKKPVDQGSDDVEPRAREFQSLGAFLAYVRSVKKLTLRQVEEATEKEVSNAYLSQLETGKITRPSPNVLHSLAKVYGVPYETLMEKAGYISPSASTSGGILRSGPPPRHGRVTTFANEKLTKDEEEKLLEYLAFLRGTEGERFEGLTIILSPFPRPTPPRLQLRGSGFPGLVRRHAATRPSSAPKRGPDGIAVRRCAVTGSRVSPPKATSKNRLGREDNLQ